MALSERAKAWIVMGNFNVVLTIDDCQGTCRTSVYECDEFAGMISDCDLT